MYESFYNLHPTPFRLTPDPHFFFESDTHKRGLAYLRFAFYQEEGFVVITGAPGTGKTELMLNLISELPRHKVTLAKIVTSNLDADDLLDLVAASFLIDPEHLSKGSLLKRLEDYFIHQAYNGKHVLLLIDEAHNLSIKSLMELSMLSNFQINEKPVMQCFLLGQDSLEEKLNIPKLVHLKQRVLASTRLENLSQQETREYITHRLAKSGWDNNPIIRDAAFGLIFYYTKGVPRKINSLCNRVLLQSYLDDRHDIGADLVHQVIEELQGEILAKEPEIDLELVATQLPRDEPVMEELIFPATTESPNSDTSDTVNTTATGNLQKNIIHSLSDANSNVIAIPEFIKKKEANAVPQTADNDAGSAKEPGDYANNVSTGQLEATILKEPEPHAITCDEDTSKAVTDNVPKDRKSINKELNNDLRQHQPHKTLQEQSKYRQSGLVDKELQALASLCDSSSPIKKSGESSAQSAKSISTAASPGKKIIIDDLACEQVNHSEWSAKPELTETKTARFDIYKNWRPAMAVLTLLVSTGLSIYWFSDGKAEKINLASDQHPKEIVAKSLTGKSVIDLLVPEIKTTLIDVKHEPGKVISSSIAPEPETSPVVASVIPKADHDTGNINTTVNTAASDTADTVTANRADANRLDRQITAIAEKSTLNSQPATKVETVSKKPAKKQLTQASTVAAGAHNSVAQTTNNNPVALAKPTTQDKKATGKDQTTTPERLTATDSTINNIEDNTTGRMPIIGTPVALQDKVNLVQTDASNAPATSSTITDESQAAVHAKSQDTTPHNNTVLISGSDLKSLLSTLATAYETGNLKKLVSTFSTDIKSSDGASREQMENDYRRLFNITDNRQLIIHDITWSQHDKQMLGSGDFRVRIREKGANQYTTYAGKISLAVGKESNNIVIRKLDYDYKN